MYKGIPGNGFFKFFLPWFVYTPDILIEKGGEKVGDCYSPFRLTDGNPNMVPDPKEPKKKITANELLKRAGKTDAIITGVAEDICVFGAAQYFDGFSHLVLNGTRAVGDIGACDAEDAANRAQTFKYKQLFLAKNEKNEKEGKSAASDMIALADDARNLAKTQWKNAVAGYNKLNANREKAFFYYDKSLNDGSAKEDHITFAKNAGLILFEVESQKEILQFKQGRIPASAKAIHVPDGVKKHRDTTFWQRLLVKMRLKDKDKLTEETLLKVSK